MPQNPANRISPEEAALDAELDKLIPRSPFRAEDFTQGEPGLVGRAINEIVPDLVRAGRGFVQPFADAASAAMNDDRSFGRKVADSLYYGSVGLPLETIKGLMGVGRDVAEFAADRTPEAGGRLAGNLGLALLLKKLPGARGLDAGGRTLVEGGRFRPTVTTGALEGLFSGGGAPMKEAISQALVPSPRQAIPLGPSSLADSSFVRGVPAQPVLNPSRMLPPAPIQLPGEVIGILERAGIQPIPDYFPPTRQHVPPGYESIWNMGERLSAQLRPVIGETPGFNAMAQSGTRVNQFMHGVNPEFPFTPDEIFRANKAAAEAMGKKAARRKKKE